MKISVSLALGFGMLLILLVFTSGLSLYAESAPYIRLDDIARFRDQEVKLATQLKSSVRDRVTTFSKHCPAWWTKRDRRAGVAHKRERDFVCRNVL